MTDDASKKTILARRAKFIAAAITSIGLASCGKEPAVCLSIEPAPQPDAHPTSTAAPDAEASQPVACLSVAAPTEDAGEKPALNSDAGTPRACLRMVTPPKGTK